MSIISNTPVSSMLQQSLGDCDEVHCGGVEFESAKFAL